MASRTDVRFDSGGALCAAYLYRPDADADGPAERPAIVMAHGFSATRDERLPAYAERFADAGYVVLVFDYRHFGASEGEPRQLLDIGRQHADYRAALAYVRGLDGVDPERVVLWGSSFSGGHVLAVGATDPRVAAVIAQVPYVDSVPTLRKVPLRNLLGITAAGVRDQVGALLGRDAHLIPAVAPPGGFAVMTAPEAEPGFAAIQGPETRWQNGVAARLGLRLPLYRPGRAAARIQAPVLVAVGDEDETTPPEPAAKVAAAAPRGELVRYPVGHFDVYLGEPFERAIADQLEFLGRHVPVAAA
jgi:dienelactone hydrolase